MVKSRGRTIDDNVIEVVVEIIKTWSGKLTWDLLLVAIKQGIGVEYTRQALANHEKITQEFTLRKRSLQLEASKPIPADAKTDAFQKKIARLEAENEQLTVECNNYRALFYIWVHNARILGITEAKLNRPLPPSVRESTEDIKLGYDETRRRKN